MRLYFLAWCRAFYAFSPVYKLYNWLDKIKAEQKPSMPQRKLNFLIYFGGKGVYNEVSRKNPTTKEEKRWLYL